MTGSAVPTQASRGAPIAFGTSGWRGIAGADFTLPRVRIAARAVAAWLVESGRAGEIVVAHDTRPLGGSYADAASEVFRGCGFTVVRSRGATPTPAAAHAVVTRAAIAAVVFTASHNPPEYAGMKVFGDGGGSLEDAQTRRIEELAAGAAGGRESPNAAPPGLSIDADLVSVYVEAVLAGIDRAALERARPQIVYDAMHGAGSGVLDRALTACGCSLRVLRGEPSPDFGGGAPDPILRNLGGLLQVVRRASAPALGIATDGDADRFAVVDRGGRLLSETEAVALLVDHLARTGRIERGVAISIATGSLVERVALEHGLHVERHPIGFKHLSRALASGTVDAAGEESGGFALGRFSRDKDGIAAGCLFAEMLAREPRSLTERLADLEARHGRRNCGRSAVVRDDAAEVALARLYAAPPKRVGDAAVREVDRRDGIHLTLDDGFVMLRASGTEPLLRIYAEAPSPAALRRRLAGAKRLLDVSQAAG